MKKIFRILVMICICCMPNVYAKEVKLEAKEYTILPGETMTLDIIVDAEESIKSGSFMITTSSRNIGFESIKFEDGITRTASGSSYTFKVTDGSLEAGSKIATVTLKANASTKEGAKTTIVLSNLKVKNQNGKTISFDTISQVVVCSKEIEKSNNNYLKEIQSKDFKLKDFDKEKTEYEVTVSAGTKTLDIQATVEDEKASIKLENTELQDGKTTAKIIVTAENGDVREYTVKVSEEVKSENEKKDVSSAKTSNYKGTWIFITVFMAVLVIVNLFLLKKDK